MLSSTFVFYFLDVLLKYILLQVSCHKDLALSKQAIASIHDTVLAFLNEQPELPHFHINESLFKPFENLLCLELCDIEIQDQVQ